MYLEYHSQHPSCAEADSLLRLQVDSRVLYSPQAPPTPLIPTTATTITKTTTTTINTHSPGVGWLCEMCHQAALVNTAH